MRGVSCIFPDPAVPRMHNPPHPGEVLRDGVFAGIGITVTEFARRLGVTRVALSRVLNGKAAISAEMAVRLGAALGGAPATWLQTYRRELAQQSEAVLNRMAQGHMVGAAAQRLHPEGRLIAHVTDLNAAVRETQEALATPGNITLFEPALRWADILVRADILERRGGTCRLIEVKSSTRVKGYHVTDAGIQTWVLRGAGLTVARTELAHIDNQFVYPGGGDYRGLFTYVDITVAILPLQEQIPDWIESAQRDLAGPMPDIAVGPHCTDPFECEFMAYCAPDAAKYPVALLPHGAKLARVHGGLLLAPCEHLKRGLTMPLPNGADPQDNIHTLCRCRACRPDAPRLTANQPDDKREHRGDNQAGHDRKEEAAVVCLDANVSRQAPKPEPGKPGPRQPSQEENRTDNDQDPLHGRHPTAGRWEQERKPRRSAAIIEPPAGTRDFYCMSTLVTNILHTHSSAEHQALAPRLR
jgi:addiction module HigA family antidote